MELQGFDTVHRVFFHEPQFYCLSNFSAHKINFGGQMYATAEAAYQAQKFPDEPAIRLKIQRAWSPAETKEIAQANRALWRKDWSRVKASVMRNVLLFKAKQHAEVRRALANVSGRLIIENSDHPFWGWGPDQQGKNMMGVLWESIAEELHSQLVRLAQPPEPKNIRCAQVRFNQEQAKNVVIGRMLLQRDPVMMLEALEARISYAPVVGGYFIPLPKATRRALQDQIAWFRNTEPVRDDGPEQAGVFWVVVDKDSKVIKAADNPTECVNFIERSVDSSRNCWDVKPAFFEEKP